MNEKNIISLFIVFMILVIIGLSIHLQFITTIRCEDEYKPDTTYVVQGQEFYIGVRLKTDTNEI